MVITILLRIHGETIIHDLANLISSLILLTDHSNQLQKWATQGFTNTNSSYQTDITVKYVQYVSITTTRAFHKILCIFDWELLTCGYTMQCAAVVNKKI